MVYSAFSVPWSKSHNCCVNVNLWLPTVRCLQAYLLTIFIRFLFLTTYSSLDTHRHFKVLSLHHVCVLRRSILLVCFSALLYVWKQMWLKEEIGYKAYLANSKIGATVLLKCACILPQAFIFAILYYKTYSHDTVAMLVLSTGEYCLTSSPFQWPRAEFIVALSLF